MNIANSKLITTSDENNNPVYSAILSLSYGTVAVTPQQVGGLTFNGNSDLLQMQSLMGGFTPKQIRNIQLAFTFPNDVNGPYNHLYLLMQDTGELIAVPQINNTCVSISVNVLPSFQVAIIRGVDAGNGVTGSGIIALSTSERKTYWSY